MPGTCLPPTRPHFSGLALRVIITIIAIFGPFIYPADPFEMVTAPMSPPGEDLLLGSDYLGRDILAGILTALAPPCW